MNLWWGWISRWIERHVVLTMKNKLLVKEQVKCNQIRDASFWAFADFWQLNQISMKLTEIELVSSLTVWWCSYDQVRSSIDPVRWSTGWYFLLSQIPLTLTSTTLKISVLASHNPSSPKHSCVPSKPLCCCYVLSLSSTFVSTKHFFLLARPTTLFTI